MGSNCFGEKFMKFVKCREYILYKEKVNKLITLGRCRAPSDTPKRSSLEFVAQPCKMGPTVPFYRSGEAGVGATMGWIPRSRGCKARAPGPSDPMFPELSPHCAVQHCPKGCDFQEESPGRGTVVSEVSPGLHAA